MRPLYGHNDLVVRFVDDLIPGGGYGFGLCQTIGVVDDSNRLVGGMVYHNYEPAAGVIEMSGAATTKRWLARHILKEIFDYPLVRLGCQIVVMRVDPANKPLHRILKSIGFDLHVIPRLRGRDRADFIFTLTDDQWADSKFSRGRHG